MSEPESFDVVVIGAGPVGENVAQYATEQTGLTAALVERELVGGECSYYACIPSKALLRPVEVAATAARLGGLGPVPLDRSALLARRDSWVSGYDDAGQVSWAAGAGIAVLRGVGRLTGEREVTVRGDEGTRILRARHAVVLATGSEPFIPEPYAAHAPWGSRDATGVVEIPDRLIIVGGGVVACEAAIWMRALGSAVTMLVREDRLLARVEPFAAETARKSLQDLGVDIRLRTNASACRRPDARDTGLGRIHGGPVTVAIEGGEITADEVLVAVGRRPRLHDVGLESVGLDPARLRAGSSDLPDWLHLIGDAGGEAPLTHWGKYRARILGAEIADRAAGREPTEVPPDVPVPQVVFTDPPIGAVGPTEQEARTAYGDVLVVQVPYTAATGASLLHDGIEGAAQLVVHPTERRVLSATFVGPEAGELLHAATIAVTARVPIHLLRHAVPSFPTASELWLRLLEALPRELRRPSSPTARPPG